MSTTFEANLKRGRIGEDRIVNWLRKRGNTVMPAYDIVGGEFKGPRVFTPKTELVSPDLLVWKEGSTYWVEAKNKTHFTWYRKNGTWQTGIDQNHYDDYLKLWQNFNQSWEIWLLFLHDTSEPSEEDLHHGCPLRCPSGLFGNRITILKECVDHIDLRWGRHGMVYWAYESLRQLAEMGEI